MATDLTIPQALFLLARDAETGRPRGYHNRHIQPAGAIAELVLRGHLRLQPGRNPRVELVEAGPTGSPYLDRTLERIAASPRPRRIDHWVMTLSGMRGRVHMIGDELVALGHVRKVPAKRFGIFRVTRWPMPTPRAKTRLMSDMTRLMFNETTDIDERTGAIIALANAGHLLKRNFDRAELRTGKPRITHITKGNWPGRETTHAVVRAAHATIAAMAAAASIGVAG